MKPALIKLSYKQTIDASTMLHWFEIGVINASYQEFLLKSQAYNAEGKYNTFQQMVAHDSRANSLHYKAGFPIAPYIELLQKNIPILKDNMDNSLPFDTYQFNILDSDISKRDAHKVSITYVTGIYTWVDTIGDYLLLAVGDATGKIAAEMIDTFLLKTTAGLSISSYRQIS